MEFLILNEQEYYEFWKNHPQKTFLSTIEIGKLREKNNWQVHYVGIKDNNKICGAAMLLSKKKKLNTYEFYSPRGILIDYNNQKYLNFFIKELTKYLKKHKAYSLRIDPYIIKKERDIDGNIVENGLDNNQVITNLEKLGFKKKKVNDTEQVTWMFSLDLTNKTEEDLLKDMRASTRNKIHKVEKSGIKLKELPKDELDKFIGIVDKTAKRKNFKSKSKAYYEEMYNLFSTKNEIKYYITELNLAEYVERLTTELNEKQLKLTNGNLNDKKKDILIKEIASLNSKINEAKAIRTKTNNDIITLSGSMFILVYPEIIYLAGGNDEDYLKFNSQYLIQWELIKYGLNHSFKKHNFYGIPENINKHPDNYGIYEFKKGFNGTVEELIGEYELPINPIYYLYKLFHKLKEVKYALHL